ncbi:hypothetical protein KA001_02970 [Patescibacteria group bacterium]|nr:hypothetical protein [Patescibacteria group bacterium]
MLKKISKLPLITSFSSIFLIVVVISVVIFISFFFVKSIIQNSENELQHNYLVAKSFSVSSQWLKGVSEIRDYKVLVEDEFNPIVFVSGLNNPTQLEVIPDSTGLERYVIVVESKFGNLVFLEDTDGDGSVDYKQIYDTNLSNPWGIFYYNNDLYVAQKNNILVYRNFLQNYISKKPLVKEIVIANLPSLAGEDYKSIYVKNDILYVAVASSCVNSTCVESDLRRASIVGYDLKTKNEEIFTKGLKSVPDFLNDGNVFYVADLNSVNKNPEISVVKKGSKLMYSSLPISSKPTSLEIHDEYLFSILSGEKKIIKYNINDSAPIFKDFAVFDSKSTLFDIVDVKNYQSGFLVSDNKGAIYYLKSNIR